MKTPCSDTYCCDPSDHLQESLGPPGPKSQKKVSKRVCLGVCKKSPKIPEKVKKYPNLNGDFFADPPKKTLFETFFAILGPEGPETPVNGRSDRNNIVPEC